MKKKINRQFMFLSSLAAAVTLLCMAVVFYHIFRAQILDDLRLYASMLSAGGREISAETMKESLSGLTGADGGAGEPVRITVIDSAGTVVYDSGADADRMDNHADRPEVREAFEKGEGSSIRQSSTMQHNTYYYTLLLEDGSVLRVAREAHSIWSILYRALPAMLAIVCALLALCLFLSHWLTKSLLAPIERMAADMDGIGEQKIYEELIPFAETIRWQHDAILKNADMRQEFTSNVSHELKSPLAVISGYSELIENGMASGQDVLRFAAEIHKSAGRLLTLINDTIRLSELDVIDRDISFEELDLYEIARDSVEILQFRAEERSVMLSMEGGSCMMQGDKQMIEELVYNLCDNALNYNKIGGSVTVSAKYVEGRPVLRVRDTGIGIPKESQDRIFERFYRVDKSRSKSTGGTGLGLAIVKHIVEAHHAEIRLESEPGRGTDITVTFADQY